MQQQVRDAIAALHSTTRVVLFVNFKGGVGKTSAALATSVELAYQGTPTLLIGLDENPGLADWLKTLFDRKERRSGVSPDLSSWRLIMRPEEGHAGLPRELPIAYDALNPQSGAPLYNAAKLRQFAAGRGWLAEPAPLAFIPDSEQLYDIESEIARQTVYGGSGEFLLEPEDRLSYALRGVGRDGTRAVLIDMPPARSKFILGNALRVATDIVVPLDFSGLAIDALERFRTTTLDRENDRRKNLGMPPLRLLGVLMLKYYQNGPAHEMHDEVLRSYTELLGRDMLFQTCIPFDPWMEIATHRRLPPQLLNPISEANEKWPAFAREVMDRARLR